MKIFHYFWPGQVHFGPQSSRLAGEIARSVGISNIFIVADPGILHLLAPLTASLAAADLPFTIFDRVSSNPDVVEVDRAAAAFGDAGADGLIGFGGGSALDTAKGVRLLAGAPPGASSADFMSTTATPRPLPAARDLPPMIAVPTTAGTGSEVTPWGVVTDTAAKQKTGLGGTRLVPDAALIDPLLTFSLPPFLTAATGMDALSHLVEAFVSTNRHPALDPLILRGVELVGANLPLAVAEPENPAARQNMMEAALLGGIAISSNWLGACHSLAHQLSTFAGLHHGLACALMLPLQMRHAQAAAADRYATIHVALTRAAGLDPGKWPTAADAVERLNEIIGLPAQLTLAVPPDSLDRSIIPEMADHAMRDPNWSTNPRPLTESEMAGLFSSVW